MTPEADYVVVRGTGSATDGVWHEVAQLVDAEGRIKNWRHKYPPSVLWPEGREMVLVPHLVFERREDGAVAQVYAPATWSAS